MIDVDLAKDDARSSPRAFITIISRSHLPFARVLAGSLRRFHDDPIYVVCVDDPEGYFEAGREQFTVLTVADLLPPEDRAMLFYYTALEMCCALRAYAHKWLLTNTTYERWIYLDSDILVTAPLEPVFDAMEPPITGVLVPHCVVSASREHIYPHETARLRWGLFNGGLLALRRSAETRRFVDWFVERLRILCFFNYRDAFVDQLWLNFVPMDFPSFTIFRHPGANVASWNLHERVIGECGGQLQANGEPLLFIHFSRWQQDRPEAWMLSRRTAPGTDTNVLRTLGFRYRDLLDEAGYSSCRRWPYGYGRFSNGRIITTAIRLAYYDSIMSSRCAEGNPFEHSEWFSRRFEFADFCRTVKRWIGARVRSVIGRM